MNKRITKKWFKKEKAAYMVAIEEAQEEFTKAKARAHQAEMELRAARKRPSFELVSHHQEPEWAALPLSRMAQESITHKLRVNAPLCINHRGPLRESDVLNIAQQLSEALFKEAVQQLMPHARSLPL